MQHIVNFDALETVSTFVAQLIIDQIQTSCEASFSLALTGGRSVKPIYEKLKQSDVLNQKKVEVFLTDERCVSYEDERCNLRLIETACGVKTAFQCLHYGTDGEQTLAHFNRCVTPNKKFDFVLLGLGDDGHIASLFPNVQMEHERKAYLRIDAPTHIEPKVARISLSLHVLNQAKMGVVLALNEHKKQQLLVYGKATTPAYPFTLLNPEIYQFYTLSQ